MMSQHLDSIKTKVKAAADHKAAAEALVGGVADALDSLTQDPVAIKAMAQELRSAAGDLAAEFLVKAAGATKPTAPSAGQTPLTRSHSKS